MSLKVFLLFWICVCFSSVVLADTLNQTISISAMGFIAIPSGLSGPMDISYYCETTNDSPFKILVTDREEFDRWDASRSSSLTYYISLSSQDYATKQQLPTSRFNSFKKPVFIFFTSNILAPAEVSISLTITPSVISFATGLIILAFALLGVIGLTVLVIRCLCKSRNRQRLVEYVPVP